MAIKFERRNYYDSFNTGNYAEDNNARFCTELSEARAREFADFWKATGCTHYETSKAHFFEAHTDARHYEQFILYK